jgi:acyl-CoA hydrolase
MAPVAESVSNWAKAPPISYSDSDACVDAILSRVGKNVILGLPVGLGKANTIANALYSRAELDKTIRLEIFTALTLGRPRGNSEIECRFLDPLFQRLAGNYPELAYNTALNEGRLPPNVSVHEFYFPAGRRLDTHLAQQAYTSTNYTHVARDLLARGINVIAQLVARRGDGVSAQLSLSCNPDITLDLLPELRRRRESGQAIAIAGQINEQLPFMLGPAVLDPIEFDFLLDGPACQFDLFGIPRPLVSLTDYAIALRVSSLIEDGGTLQLGIGGFADALTHTLKLRHLQNRNFQNLLVTLGQDCSANAPRALMPFEEGLYACTEMFVEGLLELKRVGIIRRRPPSGSGGKECAPVIHAAFFVGGASFYQALRSLSESDLADISMTAVSFINQLYGNEALKREQRAKARFINSAMMATALGAIVSDGLADGRVVSGVGGQYNLVAQAHELEGARSVIALRATRTAEGRPSSNIVWSYGHTTIPRHLRDIVTTEYGIADLRGKSDRDVVAAMLNIADSRFQSTLLAEAKRAGKIEKKYTIPDAARNNVPEKIQAALRPARSDGLLPDFPMGTELTAAEIRLAHALKRLKAIAHSKTKVLRAAFSAATGPQMSANERDCLERLGLANPHSLKDRLTSWSVIWALRNYRQHHQV